MSRFRPVSSLSRPHPIRAALGPGTAPAAPAEGLGDDLRLFLTAWAGGVVFFGTLFS